MDDANDLVSEEVLSVPYVLLLNEHHVVGACLLYAAHCLLNKVSCQLIGVFPGLLFLTIFIDGKVAHPSVVAGHNVLPVPMRGRYQMVRCLARRHNDRKRVLEALVNMLEVANVVLKVFF